MNMSSHDRVTSPRWIAADQPSTSTTEQARTPEDMPTTVLPPLPPPNLVSHANTTPAAGPNKPKKLSKSSKRDKVDNWIGKTLERRRSSYEVEESQTTRKASRKYSTFSEVNTDNSAHSAGEDDSDDEYDYSEYHGNATSEHRKSSAISNTEQSRKPSKVSPTLKLPFIPSARPRIPSNPDIHFKAKKALKQKSPKRFKRACRELKPVRSDTPSVINVRIPITALRPTEISSVPEVGSGRRRSSSRPHMSHRLSISRHRKESSSSSTDSNCSTCSEESLPDYDEMDRPPGRRGSRRHASVTEDNEHLSDYETRHRKHKRHHKDRRRSTRRRSSVTFGDMPKHVPTGIGRRVKARFKEKKRKKHKDKDRDNSDDENTYTSHKKKHKHKDRDNDSDDESFISEDKTDKHEDKEKSERKHKSEKKKHKKKERDSSDDDDYQSSVREKLRDKVRLSRRLTLEHEKVVEVSEDSPSSAPSNASSESKRRDQSDTSIASIATTDSSLTIKPDKRINVLKEGSRTEETVTLSKQESQKHEYDKKHENNAKEADSDEEDYQHHKRRKKSKKYKKDKKKKKDRDRYKDKEDEDEEDDEMSDREDAENRFRYDSLATPRKSILKSKSDI